MRHKETLWTFIYLLLCSWLLLVYMFTGKTSKSNHIHEPKHSYGNNRTRTLMLVLVVTSPSWLKSVRIFHSSRFYLHVCSAAAGRTFDSERQTTNKNWLLANVGRPYLTLSPSHDSRSKQLQQILSLEVEPVHLQRLYFLFADARYLLSAPRLVFIGFKPGAWYHLRCILGDGKVV